MYERRTCTPTPSPSLNDMHSVRISAVTETKRYAFRQYFNPSPSAVCLLWVFPPSPSLSDTPSVTISPLTITERYAFYDYFRPHPHLAVCLLWYFRPHLAIRLLWLFPPSPSLSGMPSMTISALTLNQRYAFCEYFRPHPQKSFKWIHIPWT
jgi:hypothetical protein